MPLDTRPHALNFSTSKNYYIPEMHDVFGGSCVLKCRISFNKNGLHLTSAHLYLIVAHHLSVPIARRKHRLEHVHVVVVAAAVALVHTVVAIGVRFRLQLLPSLVDLFLKQSYGKR